MRGYNKVNTFGGEQFKTKQCKVVEFTLHKPGSSERLSLTAVSYPAICSTLPSITRVSNYSHLAGLELADNSDCRDNGSNSIDVLIGSDYYWTFVIGEMHRGNQGPVAISSKLGWLLSGGIDSFHSAGHTHTHLMLNKEYITKPHEPLQDILRTFWETEAIRITKVEHQVTANFLDHIQFKDGRYEAALPWNEVCPELSDHYMNRLRHLQHLIKHPELLKEYNHIILEQLEKGIIERVDQLPVQSPPNLASFDKETKLVHYMPHHAVVRRDTTKIRIV